MEKVENLEEETQGIIKNSKRYARFFKLPKSSSFLEITESVLNSNLLSEKDKKSIKRYKRRIYLFSYPSDHLHVKGVLSITPKAASHPTILYLRGGNRDFGLFLPGKGLSNYKNYTFLAPLYRGGASEGTDEYGGDDVNDVKNLVDYIPELEKIIQQQIPQSGMWMIGSSRGAMQMFLALSRFPSLQKRVSIALSLCGLVDIHQCIKEREDMKDLFETDFGLTAKNHKSWTSLRNPLLAVKKIKKNLPIIIVHGKSDTRISLIQSQNMFKKLQKLGNRVTMIEVQKGNHGLSNIPNRESKIIQWMQEVYSAQADF